MSHTKELLASEQAALNKAAAEFALKQTILSALPIEADIKAINAFGYCADAMLIFKDASQLKELALALTPLPCTEVKGGTWTVKPTDYVRVTDDGKRRLAAPFQVVYQKSSNPNRLKNAIAENHVRWWTTLAGKTVEVHVQNVDNVTSVMDLFDAQRFEQQLHDYATGSSNHWVLRRKRVADLGLLLSYESQWTERWKAFNLSQGFNAKQAIFVTAMQTGIRNASTAAEALNNIRGNRTLVSRLGSPDTCFTADQLHELSAFYEKQIVSYAQAELDITAAFDTVKAWTLAFFANKGNPIASSQWDQYDHDTLRYLIARDTGFAGTLNFLMRTAKPGVVEVQYTLDSRTIRFEASFDVTAPNLDWAAYADHF